MSMARGAGQGVHVAIAVAGMLSLAACVAADDAGRGVGHQFPAMRLPLLEGAGEVALPAEGPVVVNVWATWCEPCRREMHALERLHRAAPGGVRVIGVSVDADANLAAEFVREQGLTFPNAIDARFQLTDGALHVDRFPTTFVVDAHGVVRLREERARDWASAQNVERVRTALVP
ncbi:MAG TPA: TlpA disulfide reductase family protein [Usitatibacter sp.]|nr:TlpA disulfide reductase family protein [Usitatibacter sp.]